MKRTFNKKEFKVMDKLVMFSVIATIIMIGFFCTDKNVSREMTNIFSVDSGSFYLRRVTIDGDKIYFVTDKYGNPIAGTTASYEMYPNQYYPKKSVSTVVNHK